MTTFNSEAMSMLTRRRFLSLASGTFSYLGVNRLLNASPKHKKRNVLFIAVDDLRPVLGCYGGKALTPSLDRFSQSAAAFHRHYVQWPVCGPSRATLMSGLRPDTHGLYGNGQAYRIAEYPDTRPTMSLHFRNHGYRTLSFGKIYHGRGASPGCGWSQPPWHPPGGWTCYVKFKNPNKRNVWRPAYEIYDGPDHLHGDHQTADKAIEAMKQNRDRPFCIFAGFYKPHLPFVAPKRYWDLYENKKIERLKPLDIPDGTVDYAYHYSEIWSYGDQKGTLFTKEKPPTHEQALNLTHAYYAAVSFIDAQIGRLLKCLDELDLSDSTAVVIWGDHGFHLGDQQRWAKHTQFEADMRSPLLIRLPGMKHKTGRLDTFAETVDIYPTLCHYCGISAPDHLEGDSLINTLLGKNVSGKKAAYSQYRPVAKQYNHLMIYTVRTRDYRYIQWRDTRNEYELVHQELYDLRTSPAEVTNVYSIEEYQPVLQQCQELIGKGFRRISQ